MFPCASFEIMFPMTPVPNRFLWFVSIGYLIILPLYLRGLDLESLSFVKVTGSLLNSTPLSGNFPVLTYSCVTAILPKKANRKLLFSFLSANAASK